MKCKLLPKIAIISALMATTACIDNNYDLSDIDTTVQLKADNLTIPINLDEIYLSNILKLNEDGNIKILDGKYAYIKQGDFESEAVNIPHVAVNTGEKYSISKNITVGSAPVSSPSAVSVTIALPENDPGMLTSYTFASQSVSNNIYGLTRIEGDIEMDIEIEIPAIASLTDRFDLVNCRLQLPRNMEMASLPAGETYSPSTGLLEFSKSGNAGTKVVLKEKIKAFNIADNEFDAATHSLNMKGSVGLAGGDISFISKAGVTIPADISVSATFAFNKSVEISAIDGEIQYNLGDVYAPVIEIKDLPGFIAQPGTDLLLENPCITLSINNPLYKTGMTARSGFTISAYHGDNASQYAIDDGYFEITADESSCLQLSPKTGGLSTLLIGSEYKHVNFSSLSRVLSGDGIPDCLLVSLAPVTIPRQKVKNFPLGTDNFKFSGKYEFATFLNFLPGSVIMYRETIDGWASDDQTEDLTIQRLEVNAKVSTNIPVGVNFTGYPVDRNGKQIGNVSIEGAVVDAFADNQTLKITITGEIRGLDGIEFRAVATSADTRTLTPDMYIRLTDIRPVVSGYYQKEL